MKAGWGFHWLETWQYRRKVIMRISIGQQGQRRLCWPCTSTYIMVGVGIPGACWEGCGKVWEQGSIDEQYFYLSVFQGILLLFLYFYLFVFNIATIQHYVTSLSFILLKSLLFAWKVFFIFFRQNAFLPVSLLQVLITLSRRCFFCQRSLSLRLCHWTPACNTRDKNKENSQRKSMTQTV